MDRYLAIAAGGALGALARYAVGVAVGERVTTEFPVATLAVNVTGSFLLGFVLTLVADRTALHPNWRLAVAVGFLGAYTTFSTFEYETLRLLETRRFAMSAAYVLASVAVCLVAVWSGAVAARALADRPAPDLPSVGDVRAAGDRTHGGADVAPGDDPRWNSSKERD